MEAKMRKHLKAGELDMAFDVILNSNAQQARAHEGNEAAANILQHLATMLAEERDKRLPAETRLLRMLLRTTEGQERQSMMLEKLILPNPPKRAPREPVEGEEEGEVVEEEVGFWGPPEVEPEALLGALKAFLEEIASFQEEMNVEVVERAKALEAEVRFVVAACQ